MVSTLKMMKLYLLLLTMLVGSHCDETDNVVDIGQTVKEVESILAEDPKLPRLTRGEIVSLIEEVRKGKDLMVVLPQHFNATLEEMYTARPVTQIIPGAGHDESAKTTKRPMKRRRKPIRPVYVHTTDSGSSESVTTVKSTKVTAGKPLETTTEDWKPQLYITPLHTTMRANIVTSTEPSSVKPEPPAVGAAAAESLSPDMKELLSSFGLLGSTGGQQSTTTTERTSFMIKSIAPSVDPSSYSRFKPLPSASAGMSQDMKSFLANFGLLDIRQAKAQKPQEDPLEGLPHRDILEDLGFRKGKKLNHVFNPNLIRNTTEELNKVNNILTKLRQYSEGNGTALTDEEVDELILLENNTRLETDDSEITLQSLKSKNDFKRQQPNNATESADELTTTTTESNASDETVTTTERSSAAGEEASSDTSASAVDLEDSFGNDAMETSTRRPNGFYFLLDWNSFLDVGLENRQVNLNFSPKVGDPRNFLSVNVP